ncbi:MAG: hypothetical protein PHR35_23340 [Kiritimatiellae bacterium]|nr:hypothetical protein [Kiritimatiellia bacterium]
MRLLLAWTLLVLLATGRANCAVPAWADAVSTNELALIDAWHAGPDPKAMPVENLALPIAHHPNGRTRAQIRAARAFVPTEGYIRAHDVVVEMYASDGRLEAVFIAENCIYDRESGGGYCEGKVRIERQGVRVTGVDMIWQSQAESARIMSQAEVRSERFIRNMGALFK